MNRPCRLKSLSENHLGEGDSPILLRRLRKIGTVPGGSRRGSLSWLVLLVALAPRPAWAEPEAAGGVQAVLVTVEDVQISARITGLVDGRLTLAGPAAPSSVHLADVQRIEIGKSAVKAAGSDLTWIGQDNHDLVQVGGASGGNGIQDLHLHIANLKPTGLKQVAVVCRFPSKLLRGWRLDTAKSPHWRLAIARTDVASEADLYLEPPAEDSYDQKFDATFTYNDGTTTTATVKATTHTSDQLKVDSGTKPGQVVAKPAAGPSQAIVYAGPLKSDQGRLHGDVKELNAESLTLHTDWKADIQIPLLRVQGIWFGKSAARTDFERQLNDPASEDVVFLIAPDKSVAQVAGSVQALSEGKLTLRFQGADRTVKEDRLLGVVFAAHPKIPAVTTPFQMFTLASGDSILGTLAALGEHDLEIETLWQSRVKIPTAAIAEIRMRNGKLTFLGDLEPSAVEEVGYFGRVIHWQRDQGFDGGPPKVKGQQPSRSLAMHSRSVLTYELDGQYEKFKARVGFDDSAAGRGRAVCRVLVDGRELFVEKDLRGDQDPRAVEVSVQGAKQLALEVDFGEAEDIGDRIIWAEPRLFRAEPK